MFVFAKRESKEVHVARNSKKSKSELIFWEYGNS